MLCVQAPTCNICYITENNYIQINEWGKKYIEKYIIFTYPYR